ncbi:hypothetical protein [Mesorhizobium sp. WSM2561]|uniref:hypothetical protein n=1 Tax=Mesorhizobium sp. WSM2561 TaxID=1040985 RepID=UPI000481047D|nr:hypothetical protein [Mesorhizobium sp. WSM2561]
MAAGTYPRQAEVVDLLACQTDALDADRRRIEVDALDVGAVHQVRLDDIGDQQASGIVVADVEQDALPPGFVVGLEPHQHSAAQVDVGEALAGGKGSSVRIRPLRPNKSKA